MKVKFSPPMVSQTNEITLPLTLPMNLCGHFIAQTSIIKANLINFTYFCVVIRHLDDLICTKQHVCMVIGHSCAVIIDHIAKWR